MGQNERNDKCPESPPEANRKSAAPSESGVAGVGNQKQRRGNQDGGEDAAQSRTREPLTQGSGVGSPRLPVRNEAGQEAQQRQHGRKAGSQLGEGFHITGILSGIGLVDGMSA